MEYVGWVRPQKDEHAKVPPAQFWLALLFLLIAGVLVRNAAFHPLSSFPGPLLARSSLAWRIFHSFRGRLHTEVAKCHKIYGPVVRVSPNELSFATASSWKDIYGSPSSGRKPFIKSEFYSMYGAGFKAKCIGSERDPAKHKRIRGLLSSAFSTRTLLEQEQIVHQVIDGFVDKLKPLKEDRFSERDLTAWYGMLGFDLMGEMGFGESFHAIETGKPHFWTKLITDHLFFVTVADNLRRLPFVPTIAGLLVPAMKAFQKKHMQYTQERITRRMNNKDARKDFLTTIIPKVHEGELDQEELLANASTLIIGGSDSVVSALAGTTFHILNPSARQKHEILKAEVRSHFKNYEDIKYSSAQRLPYLNAVIREGLRIFPPGHGMPRISPGAMVSGFWVPKGTEVYTSPWPISQNEEYYIRPKSFEPERWLEQSDNVDGEWTYTKDVHDAGHPFQLGPHNCLGQNFAMMEMTLILAKLVWRYDMELVDGETYWPEQCRSHIMWLKPPLLVRFTEVRR